jgi:glycyl-tRNA synthetase beta chain
MAELFIELFSEEIPARMQARAAEDLARLIRESLAALRPKSVQTYYGPRRIALAADVAGEVAAASVSERGPRANAPEQALAGFLRKHNAMRDQLRLEGEYWVLERRSEAAPAASVIAAALPGLLRRFPWPKSMRWGEGSAFTWVRPLRRIVCLLDGTVVPFDLRDGPDDGHGLHADDKTEGHRFHAPEAFSVSSCADWQAKLSERDVIVDAGQRQRAIAQGIDALAAAKQLLLVPDEALLAEVAGLVEWPVPLLGEIDAAYMDLPPEVMQVSMRVNQRYFAVRTPDGDAAPWFAFVANIAADDGGAAIIAGNERVLRARFADARHFWDLDRKTKLADRVAALDRITFHARLGTQGERVGRLVALAGTIAPMIGADPALAQRAALLAKADLVTGMVGEFPELQGVMGGYYARHDGENAAVANAIRDHYAPAGAADEVPGAPVSVAVALADKLDQLTGFFAIGEKPTGSGDPYALRRAALGVIRLVRDNRIRLELLRCINAAAADRGDISLEVFEFVIDRLRVQLRTEGARHDVLAAVFAAGADDDIVRLLARTDAVAALLGSEDGANLLTAYKRAANILRIENKKDGPHEGEPDPALLKLAEEDALFGALRHAQPAIASHLVAEDYAAAMSGMARLRGPLDAFFDKVTVNAPEPELRRNRLRLLAQVRATMDQAADFSRIES